MALDNPDAAVDSSASSVAVAEAPAPSPVTSALEALERAAATGGDSSSPTPSPETRPADAGQTAPATTAPGGPTGAKGEAPESRIQAAVRNARAELESELGWARSMGDRPAVERAVGLIRRLEADPRAFARQLLTEIGDTPTPAPATEPDLSDPDPDLKSEDGQAVYSAATMRVLIQNAVTRATKDLTAQFAPALEFTNQGRAQVEHQQFVRQTEQQATSVLTKMREQPYFKDHEAAINAEFSALPADVFDTLGPYGALYEAYTRVLGRDVLPTLGRATEAKVIQDLKRSAAAGTPGATVVQAPVKARIKDGDVDALARRLAELSGETSAT